jgi:hypothetical protein
MPVVTLMPMPYFTGFDADGVPIANGKVKFYKAGTSTPATVYQDGNGAVPHPATINLDGSGNATIYFDATQSYKMELYDAANVFVRERDNMAAVPSLSADLDYIGTAGENIAAREPVYLENGLGGGTIGKWYRTDSASAPKSYQAVLTGIAPAAVLQNAQGKFRSIGAVDGFLGLTPGATYYIGPLGTITNVAPANARELGLAESASRLLLTPPRPNIGLHEMFIPAGAFVPKNNAPCGWHEDILIGGQHAYRGMPFDPTTVESAVCWHNLPKSWGRGTITFQVHCLNKVGGAGSVVFTLLADSRGHNENFDGTTGGSASVTVPALAANKQTLSPESGPVTLTGPPAAGEMQFFHLTRATGDAADNYGSDMYFLGVTVRLVTTAATDA